MWARTVEIMLGVWLAISPFVFGHMPEPQAWWINDFACGLLIITFACLSFWHPTRHAHLLHIAVGFWMFAFAYYQRFWVYPDVQHAPAELQNLAATAFLLLMFAILPNDATRPPSSWERFRVPERVRSADHLPETASDVPAEKLHEDFIREDVTRP